jgi:UDP-N-acetylmuramoyl-tripeptide--D-alanyl-D-alanine ligase
MLSGETEEEIRAGLLCFSPEHLRQNIYKRNGYVIMEDCYNASPESMQAALDVLISYRRFSSGKTIAILGDMLELGEESSALHRQVGAHLAKRGIDRLITLGKGGGYIAVGAKQCGMKSDRICEFSSYEERLDEIASAIREVSAPGDVLLFKASRGVRIERLIECFEKQLR